MSRLSPLGVWYFGRAYDLLAPGRAVLAAVSGGPDSLALLDLLHALAAKHGFPLAVAHFDHGLRPDSAEDAEFVRAESEKRGRAFYTERGDTPAFAAENKLSLEAAARQLRYNFLKRAARQAGCEYVAVAHTQDDQAETVLMHLLRGSGMTGLRGMLPRSWLKGIVPGEEVGREGRLADASPLILIRPLLETSRAEVEAYCAERGLLPRQDASNADRRFTRNRVRHDILPALERENPNIRATLARTANILASQHRQLDRATANLWAVAAPPGEQSPGQAARIERAAFLRLPREAQLALLRVGATQVLGDSRDLDAGPLLAARGFAAAATPGRSCEIARGLKLRIEADRLVLFVAEPPRVEYPLLLEADGRLPAGWRLVAEPMEAWPVEAKLWEAVVPTERLTGPLGVRARRRGERFQPFGMGGRSQKLSDYLTNAKIAAAARDRWPIVVCGDTVVWVAGLRLDERFRVGAADGPCTRLRFEYTEPSKPEPEG